MTMWRDGTKYYGWLSIFLHWGVGALVIGLYVYGNQAGDIYEAIQMIDTTSTDPAVVAEFEALKAERSSILGLHIGTAGLFWLLILGRIVWRAMHHQLAPVPQHFVLQQLALWVPRLMLAVLTIMILTGPLLVWSRGYPISIYGWFSIASPIGKVPGLGDTLSPVHIYGGHTLFVLLLVHVLGTLKHLLLDRNWRSLKRILRPERY